MSKKIFYITLLAIVTACQSVGYRNNSYELATEKFVAEEYSQALLYYNDYLQKSPNGANAEDAMYGIIKCLTFSGNRGELFPAIYNYQSKYPNGKYLNNVTIILNQIESSDKDRKAKQAETAKTWEKRYEELKGDLSKDPGNANILLSLGHTAWNLDRYEESAEYYGKAIKAKPSYLTDSLLRSRVEFDNEGNLHANIPPGVAGSDLTRLGVRIRDTRSYYREEGGRDTGVSRVYVLTGKVINETTEVIPKFSPSDYHI